MTTIPRKVGRPALGAAKRGAKYVVALTADELAAVEAAAKQAGISRAEWSRRVLVRAASRRG